VWAFHWLLKTLKKLFTAVWGFIIFENFKEAFICDKITLVPPSQLLI